MADSGLTERLLRHDRSIVLLAIAGVVAAAAAYTVLGIGMPMSAIEMSTMAETRMDDISIPSMLMPAAWSADYASLRLSDVVGDDGGDDAAERCAHRPPLHRPRADARPSRMPPASLDRRLHARLPARLGELQPDRDLACSGCSSCSGLVSPAMMTLTSGLVGGSALLAAAAYQLTPAQARLPEALPQPDRSSSSSAVDRARRVPSRWESSTAPSASAAAGR